MADTEVISAVASGNSAPSSSTKSERSNKSPSDPAFVPDEPVKTDRSIGDSSNVFRSGIIGIIMVVISVLLVVVATFLLLQGEENFETTFNQFADSVVEDAQDRTNAIVASFEALSFSITSFALTTNATWPNVTFADFEARVHNMRIELTADLVGLSPLVKGSDREAWEEYSVAHQGWIEESSAQAEYLESERIAVHGYDPGEELEEEDPEQNAREPIYPFIFRLEEESDDGDDDSDENGDRRKLESTSDDTESLTRQVAGEYDLYAPIWQLSPPPKLTTFINYDLFQQTPIVNLFSGITPIRHAVISPIVETEVYETAVGGEEYEELESVESIIMQPVYDQISDDKVLVAFLYAVLPWDRYLQNSLPVGVNGIVCVIRNTCGQVYSFQINGPTVIYLGEGDHHDRAYDGYEIETEIAKFGIDSVSTQVGCHFSLVLYPSSEFENSIVNQTALIWMIAVACVICAASVAFLIINGYKLKVRDRKLLDTANRTTAIVSSLFPANIRDRLLEDAVKQTSNDSTFGVSAISKVLKGQQDTDSSSINDPSSKPIADLFPACTVLFADLVGFTAWSSSKEPSQVFTLLETIYASFDAIARRRNVFKVETIGDCYVAVSGIPQQRRDHAVIMARFARDCLVKLGELVKELEVVLGPDTTDLSLRIGLHSGPVTAGVLRGERSRFQLFGDTVNTASRMESCGETGRIQVSEETAKLLNAVDKKWAIPRHDKIIAKGKGEMQTYWLDFSSRSPEALATSTKRVDDVIRAPEADGLFSSEKSKRLVEWNVEILLRILKQIVARREAMGARSDSPRINENRVLIIAKCPIEDVQEIISLPDSDNNSSDYQGNADEVDLSPEVVNQLNDFVSAVCALYRDNPFHNFEHCSHVVLSVSKLMARIVAPSSVDMERDVRVAGKTLHDHTYGITSDPLTQFACVFAALIHDLDHSGVPNTQVIVENKSLADTYKNRSVAEQNSLDIGWTLLMEERFAKLRAVLYTTDIELRRFRELVVNSVMATDIADAVLKEERNARWEKAFGMAPEQHSQSNSFCSDKSAVDRKATIVIEHLIQASDVAHTMQHWVVYRKWNQRLFFEMYKAYMEGRASKDPSEFWYQGELGFFDYYIIPLARKLQQCGVFGVSSDEYLLYAQSNRQEWEKRGQSVVSEMVEAARHEFSANPST